MSKCQKKKKNGRKQLYSRIGKWICTCLHIPFHSNNNMHVFQCVCKMYIPIHLWMWMFMKPLENKNIHTVIQLRFGLNFSIRWVEICMIEHTSKLLKFENCHGSYQKNKTISNENNPIHVQWNVLPFFSLWFGAVKFGCRMAFYFRMVLVPDKREMLLFEIRFRISIFLVYLKTEPHRWRHRHQQNEQPNSNRIIIVYVGSSHAHAHRWWHDSTAQVIWMKSHFFFRSPFNYVAFWNASDFKFNRFQYVRSKCKKRLFRSNLHRLQSKFRVFRFPLV